MNASVHCVEVKGRAARDCDARRRILESSIDCDRATPREMVPVPDGLLLFSVLSWQALTYLSAYRSSCWSKTYSRLASTEQAYWCYSVTSTVHAITVCVLAVRAIQADPNVSPFTLGGSAGWSTSGLGLAAAQVNAAHTLQTAHHSFLWQALLQDNSREQSAVSDLSWLPAERHHRIRVAQPRVAGLASQSHPPCHRRRHLSPLPRRRARPQPRDRSDPPRDHDAFCEHTVVPRQVWPQEFDAVHGQRPCDDAPLADRARAGRRGHRGNARIPVA